MKNLFVKILVLSLIIALGSFGFRSNMESKKSNRVMKLSKTASTTTSKSGMVGDAYAFMVNKFLIPMDNRGVLGDVSIDGLTRGEYEGGIVLFSGGFMISGFVDTGKAGAMGHKPWASAMASASRLEDYVPGPWNKQNDLNAQVYVVNKDDAPFGQSWQDWRKAVALGADFYDGDHDGSYNPVDKNGNGQWDRDEDKPDMIGEETAWCVYSDGRRTSQRGFVGEAPQGIEIQQTLFGFNVAGPLGNMAFLRYRIISRDTITSTGDMDSVYFGVWADPDIGEYTDDLVGCDTLRKSGYGFSNGYDTDYGINPPCCMISFFQGPVVYEAGNTFTDADSNGIYDPGIDTPLKTAIEILGQDKGMKVWSGARNLGLSSFINYVQSDPNRGDPYLSTQARNYMMGLLRDGKELDPCTDKYGGVHGGENCATINKKFWYSGDPVTDKGWIYSLAKDIRIMSNIGPFTLKKNQPVDIVVALIVGQGSDALSSITVAREYADIAQIIYNGNFRTPPPPPPVEPVTVRATDKEIYLTWETKKQFNFIDQAFDSIKAKYIWDMRFEGYEVTAYRNPVTSLEKNGITNSRIIARYDLKNKINSVYLEDADGSRTKQFEAGISLDTIIFKGDSGRITLKIDKDPFDGTPLIKGKAYYFSITGHALNYVDLKSPNKWLDTTDIWRQDTIRNNDAGDYLFPKTSLFTYTANNPEIISWGNPPEVGIRPGTYTWDPVQIITVDRGQSAGEVKVTLEEVYKDSLTGDTYSVNFFKDSTHYKYGMMWKLTNNTTNKVLLDSQRVYNFDKTSTPILAYTGVVEGFRVKVDSVNPGLKQPYYSGQKWYKSFVPGRSGAMYVGDDISDITLPTVQDQVWSKFIKADKLRQVEIRFGSTQKAYKYILHRLMFGAAKYAAGVDTNITPRSSGFIDVPFQIWEKDARLGTERQLAMAFIDTMGRPSGWDPGTDIAKSFQYILIFDSPYTTDSLVRYTGGNFNGVERWADILRGWMKPASWTNMTPQDSIISKSRWFDVLYAVGFERSVKIDTVWWGWRDSVRTIAYDTLFYKNGDIFTIPVTYPILSTDVFTFTTRKKGEGLTDAEKQATWARVNVYPNPLFAFNPGGSYIGRSADDPYVTFSNLPPVVTVRIFTLSGALIRTLTQEDKRTGKDSPSLEWDLKNSSGLRVASGMYIALVTSPGFSEKVLKLAVIMPQKQIKNY